MGGGAKMPHPPQKKVTALRSTGHLNTQSKEKNWSASARARDKATNEHCIITEFRLRFFMRLAYLLPNQ